MPEAIKTENLTKRFAGLTAVEDINLAVPAGEIFGLVGPDGAGKTTLIRLLATILLRSDGDAQVGGYSVTDQAQLVRPLVGYMSQRFTLYVDLTVLENLRFFADIYRIPADVRAKRIEELLAFSQLTGFTERPAGQLSGGMKQKLALACTLIHEPRILLLDEPTTGVDPVSRRDFWKILSRLHQDGATIFVATPYMDEAERCQRVALMKDGKIVLCDSPANIKALVPGEVVAIEVGDAHQGARVLREHPLAMRVDMYGEVLHVYTDDAGVALPGFRRRLEEAGIGIVSIHPVELSMENAYIHLAGRIGGQTS
ncbi:MAG: ABC transporter ATP-binding protein [Actinomycetota bacterium]|nr:ABC transporter ATP-binding protein [Actinomycetota bacterium]